MFEWPAGPAWRLGFARMKCLRIYAGPDGESHFADAELPLNPVTFLRRSRRLAELPSRASFAAGSVSSGDALCQKEREAARFERPTEQDIDTSP